ncbi:hypothetical protein SK128_023823 [Halocaridina rubra]|uniref:C2H2-type domain-containing protein n=1 Tax=Halocaridina rubra TaxID=373956 RepID=A0AAN8WB96_HALRR
MPSLFKVVGDYRRCGNLKHDVIVNQPLQVQVAVPTVQMIAALATQTPASTPISNPPAGPLTVDAPVSAIPVKGKKSKKPSSTDDVERNNHCEECGASFASTCNLRSHMRIHSGVRPHECEVCGKAFLQSSNLKAHKRVHTGERPYQCSECGQTFSRSSHLVGHKRTHTGERPYICGICGEAFYTSSQLRNHVRRHTGEKPYVCKHCGETFSQNVELKVHIRYHTGERPFKCLECDLSYISARELKAHRKGSHYGSKPFACDMCNRCFRTKLFLEKHLLRCSGPRIKRPKGRPRKYPRIEGEAAPWKTPKKPKNRIPAAPTDRATRSKSKALQIEQMKKDGKATCKEEKTDVSNSLSTTEYVTTLSSESLSKKLRSCEVVSDQPKTPDSIDVLPINPPLKHEVFSDEQITQLPMVQLMLENLSSGAEGISLQSSPSNTLHSLHHALSQQTEQLGVMDLSGQQIHSNGHSGGDTLAMLTSQLSQGSVLSSEEQMPVVPSRQHVSSDHRSLDNIIENQLQMDAHQKLPVITAHQQSVNTVPLSVVTSLTQAVDQTMTSLPLVSAHQQTLSNSLGLVNSHQQSVSAHNQQLLSVPVHQHLPTILGHHSSTGAAAHQHIPSVTAHQNLSTFASQNINNVEAHQQLLAVSTQNFVSGSAEEQASSANALQNTVTAHQNIPLVNTHLISSTTTAHQNLPVVKAHHQITAVSGQQLSTTGHQPLATGLINQQVVNTHQQLPVVSAHQQIVTTNQQISGANLSQSLPIVAAHQCYNVHQQQHISAVPAHQTVSSISQQQMPIVSAHQQNSGSHHSSVAVTAQRHQNAHLPGLVVAAHQQTPAVSHYKHQDLLQEDDKSQVIYEGGQPFVVDLSSPALTSQVSLVNQTVTSTPYART